MTDTQIRGGVEWFKVPVGDGTWADECQCARCGSSVEWVDCYNCDDGDLGSDCIDDLCHGGECMHGDSGFIRCDICNGKGGWWRCISGREWCLAHPLEGRAGINTTAYDGEDE